MLRLALLLSLVWWAAPAAAFGAGNIASISKVEGKNWRHGDIEDVLLSLAAAHAYNRGKKFSKLMIKQTYLGNWCRDYSQAIDVGTVKAVSAEAIRLLLCVLGFMTFGYGSGEFEITADRLGCYRPEEHIDNPKGYGEGVDARNYDRRLRGPIDEETELAVDEETGMKNYIANERIGIMTSADLLRRLISGCVEKGRRYKDNNNKRDLHESLRLLGTALHCLEDFYAHSNYVELALIELGERDVFPHVGSNTQIRLQGARGSVFPIVTGTFGGVDFLHSVTGEVSDKLTQNEIDELEGTLQESAKSDTSLLKDLLDKIPDGIFGDKHESDKLEQLQENANNAQMENMNVSPREPEEFTRYIQQVYGQVLPVIEFHDEIMKGITAAIEKIPVLPKIIEQLEEELSRFVFSLIAPFVVPLIQNIKNELATGSNQIIESSEAEQHVVFDNDDSSDPTHSMLSKDHFTNILNEIAGQSAAKMITWVVPQIMEAIDDESVDVNRLVTRIVNGVMHHPAQREMGDDGAQEGRQQIFQAVQEWWSEMGEDQRQDYRRKLSRRGVQNGENHKEGVYDTGHGHGCSGKLKMQKLYGEPETMEDKIASAAAGAIISGAAEALGGGNGGGKNTSGGDLGGFLGALGSALGVGGDDGETKKKKNRRDDEDEDENQGSSYQQSSYGGHNTSSYGQSESYSQGFNNNSRQESRYGGGGEADSYSQGYGSSQQSYGRSEERRHESGGYGSEQRQGGYGGGYGGSDERRNEGGYGGGYGGSEERRQESRYGGGEADTYSQGYGSSQQSYGRSEERRHESGGYGSEQRQGGYGGGYGGSDERRNEGGYGGGYGGSSEHRRRDSNDSDEEKKHRRRKSNDSDEEREQRYRRDDSDDSDKRKHHGRRRGSNDDDDDNERRGGYGGSSGGYGGGGYRQEGGYGGDGGYGGGGGYGGNESYGGGYRNY
ncbi:unnamed protein product [Clonostachys byssicola]|uniref:NIMA-interacting protein TinC n=1 Tax=Clonostachys byssicola TaxID=160290 RepID=A0A9N9Y1C7_9HYPO|nr:unnamed protein product [Clonostachys byssicola]